jgi:hypothetical protein
VGDGAGRLRLTLRGRLLADAVGAQVLEVMAEPLYPGS